MKTIQLILISDSHSKHKQMTNDILSIPNLEESIIIHSGDVSTRGYEHEIKNFLEWYSNIPCQSRIWIEGNHDWLGENHPSDFDNLIVKYPEVIHLRNSSVVIDGIKYYGAPQQPTFFNWAFNVDRGEDIKKIWDKIDEDTNVLITHGPPHMYGDEVEDSIYNPTNHVGCVDLLNRINELPTLLMSQSGHIHEGYGVRKHIKPDGKEVTMINASMLDDRYEYTHKPIVYQLEY